MKSTREEKEKQEHYTNTLRYSLTRSELSRRVKAMKKNEIDKKIYTHAQRIKLLIDISFSSGQFKAKTQEEKSISL